MHARLRPTRRFARPRAPRLFAALAACTCLAVAASPAWAQVSIKSNTGAQSLTLDPSVRAGGMGRASGAVFWGDGPNYWANAALLADGRGLRFEQGRTRLLPELASDMFLTTNRLTFGYRGLGLLAVGYPLEGMGGSKLDYGTMTATDVDGNPIMQLQPYEETRALGASGNLFELGESIARATGRRLPALSRFGDVGFGWIMNRTHVALAPVSLGSNRTSGDVTTYDSGMLARLTPYDAVDHEGFVPLLDRWLPVRVDFAYGSSIHNYSDERIHYEGTALSDPVIRLRRLARSERVAVGFPSVARDALEKVGLGWLPASLTPLVSWGKAWDHEAPKLLDPVTRAYGTAPEAKYNGWEVTIANVYSVRRGHVDDPDGLVHGDTKGWSVGLHVKDLGGFSYDESTVPQSIYFGPVHRKAFSVFVDPVKAWGAIRGSGESGP